MTIMLDVSDEDSYNAGTEVARALSKINAASYEERRRLAATSKDPALLTALSEVDEFFDPDLERLLLMNSITPARALTTIARRRCKRLTPPGPDEYEVTKDEAAVLDIIRHPNVDPETLAMLSSQHSWAIRYAVAMEEYTPTQVLDRLAKDENLAVKAMASSRLGVPVEEEETLKLPISCSQLDKKITALAGRLSSCVSLSSKISSDLGLSEFPPSDEFERDSVKAFSELRRRITERYVAMAQQKYFPNLDISRYDFPKLMAAFGDMHFDAYLIAVKLKELMGHRSTIAIAELLSKARQLLPYLTRESPLSSWGPANQPEQVLEGARLKLQAFVHSIPDLNITYPEFETVEQIAALDKVTKVVLENADPATVTSNMSTILSDMRTPREVFRKIRIGEPFGILAIRFYRNHRFDVQYASEENARKIAEALMSTSKNSQSS